MLRYDPGMADRVAQVAAEVLGRSVETIWEDMGTYLVTNPEHEGVRRLLRFGGASFADFLHSLEEMPGRARLAMPDLELARGDAAGGRPGPVRTALPVASARACSGCWSGC